MTRTEFIRNYAAKSKLSAEWADLGYLEIGDRVRIALPCACSEECEGWALIGPDSVDSHLRLYAPEPLRSAYIAAINLS